MEPLFLLLTAVPFVFTALVVRSSNARVSSVVERNAWKLVAREDGFVERPDGSWVLRVDDDFEIQLSGRRERTDGDFVQAVVPIVPKLPTELRVTPQRGSVSSDARVSFDFDRRFRLESPRPQRAARVLRRGTAARLVAADASGWIPSLSQDEVRVAGRWLNQRRQTRALRDWAVTIARGLVADEAALPELVPWNAVRRAWRRAAEGVGAHLDEEARMIELTAPFGVLAVHARTEREEHWFGEIAIVFERPLDAAFEIASDSARSIWDRLWTRDLELGDAEFDKRFFVTASEPERVRDVLDPELRGALVELERDTGPVLFTAERIDARIEDAAALDPSTLERGLRLAIRVADLVLERARAKRAGAYR